LLFFAKLAFFISYKLIPTAKRATRKEELILGRPGRSHKSTYKNVILNLKKELKYFAKKIVFVFIHSDDLNLEFNAQWLRS